MFTRGGGRSTLNILEKQIIKAAFLFQIYRYILISFSTSSIFQLKLEYALFPYGAYIRGVLELNSANSTATEINVKS